VNKTGTDKRSPRINGNSTGGICEAEEGQSVLSQQRGSRRRKTDTVKTDKPQDPARVRQLAEQLNYFTEEDFALLANATPLTVEAWRKRGQGPAYVRLGRRFYYPAAAVKAYLEKTTRTRNTTAGGLL
jgi:DNA-binding transcriptional regulator YiaG